MRYSDATTLSAHEYMLFPNMKNILSPETIMISGDKTLIITVHFNCE